jgi:hypothetical protein
MTDTDNQITRGRRPQSQHPERIELATGRVLILRTAWAAARGMSPRTAARMNLPGMYVAGLVYLDLLAADEMLAARIRRRNVEEPPRRRRPMGRPRKLRP